jgi:hypothetical protein
MQLLPEIKSIVIETDPRRERAETILQVYQAVQLNQDGSYTVSSQFVPNKSYQVRLSLNGNGYCKCPDFTYRRIECKHILAVKSYAGGNADPSQGSL